MGVLLVVFEWLCFPQTAKEAPGGQAWLGGIALEQTLLLVSLKELLFVAVGSARTWHHLRTDQGLELL